MWLQLQFVVGAATQGVAEGECRGRRQRVEIAWAVRADPEAKTWEWPCLTVAVVIVRQSPEEREPSGRINLLVSLSLSLLFYCYDYYYHY